MLKNFLLVAFRNIMRSRLYSLINILGLTIGLATSLFIAIYVKQELGYEKHFNNWERIYRVHMKAHMNGNDMNVSRTGAPVAEVIMKELPGVIKTTRLIIDRSVIIKVGESIFNEPKVYFADSTFYDIFNYKIINGNIKNLLNRPQTVVLTESTAKKYFGTKNPVGETIKINDNDYQVTGVVEDCKYNSHFHYDIMASLITYEAARSQTFLNDDFFNTYVLLDKKADFNKINAAFHDLMLKKIEPEIYNFFRITISDFIKQGNMADYHLFPIHDIHLKSHSFEEFEQNSSIIYVYIFIVIATFILLIACINYMNLSTARSTNRAKETAMRKVIGASRSSLIGQFLIESVIQSLFALLLALIFIESILPAFNRMTSQNLSIGYTDNIWIIPGLIALGIIIGLISGLYSAIHLSSVKIITMLKSKLLASRQHKWFRNVLVVFQFSISIFIIISTLIIFSQLRFIQNSDIGFDKKNMLVIKNIILTDNRLEAFKQKIAESSGIKTITGSSRMICEPFSGFPAKSEEDMNTARVSRMLVADNNLIKTFGLTVVAGRYFSDDFKNDTFSIVINETAVKEYNFKNPIGKHVVTQYNGVENRWKIIGVVKDFNFSSLHDKISSLVILHPSQGNPQFLTIKYESQNTNELIACVKSTWQKFFPNVPFEYFIFEDKYTNTYHEEYRTSKLFTAFSLLAIFISCLGLFGLASFLAEKKSREIAIRKVNGASELSVVIMLLKQFTFWTLIANIVAYPAAWFFAKGWLQNFAYHVDIKIWYFLIATIMVFAIAIVTVVSQALMAARTNPAEKLKYE